MDEAVSLIQTTVDLNTIPTFRQEWDKLEPDVDGVACLKVLEDIALSVLPKEKQIQRCVCRGPRWHTTVLTWIDSGDSCAPTSHC